MKNSILFAILIWAGLSSMTTAFASTKDIKVTDLVGEYTLAKAVEGDCTESLTVQADQGESLSLFAYGTQPSTVQLNTKFEMSDLNAGPRVKANHNGLNGQFYGWSRMNATLTGNLLTLENLAFNPFWIPYWKQLITATYENGQISYRIQVTEYEMFSIKENINQCVYRK